jgi:hypothetical protein
VGLGRRCCAVLPSLDVHTSDDLVDEAPQPLTLRRNHRYIRMP